MFNVDTDQGKIKFTFGHVAMVDAVHSHLTLCFLDVWEGEKMVKAETGMAFCSRKDQFKKATGRKVALARALKKAGLGKAARAAVWSRYNCRSIESTKYEKLKAALEDVYDRSNGQQDQAELH